MWKGPEMKESLEQWGRHRMLGVAVALRARGSCEEARGRQGRGQEDHSSDLILKPWETTNSL